MSYSLVLLVLCDLAYAACNNTAPWYGNQTHNRTHVGPHGKIRTTLYKRDGGIPHFNKTRSAGFSSNATATKGFLAPSDAESPVVGGTDDVKFGVAARAVVKDLL